MGIKEAIVYEHYKNDRETAMKYLVEGKINGEVIVRETTQGEYRISKNEVANIYNLLFGKEIFKDATIESLLEMDGRLIKLLEMPTHQQQMIAVNKEPACINYIQNPCKDAIAITMVKNPLYSKAEHIGIFSDSELMTLLEKNPDIITLIPKERITSEILTEYLRKMVQDNRKELIGDYQRKTNIPENLMDKLYYRAYCMVDGYNYCKIPKQYISEKLIYYTLEHSTSFVGICWMYQYLPEEFKTEDISKKCCIKHFGCIEYLPEKFQNDVFYRWLLENGQKKILSYINYDTVSDELLLEIVRSTVSEWSLIPEIPTKRWNNQLAMVVVVNNRAPESVPKKLQTDEWKMEYIKKTGNVSIYPVQKLTEDICIEGMKANAFVAIKYIPENMKTESFWKRVVEEKCLPPINSFDSKYITKEVVDTYMEYKPQNLDLQMIPQELLSDDLVIKYLNEGVMRYREVLKVSQSNSVKQAIIKACEENDNLLFCAAECMDTVPTEIIDKFVDKKQEVIHWKTLTKEQINRSIEYFPENILDTPQIPEKQPIKESEREQICISQISDFSNTKFVQMSIWDILKE